MSTLIFDFDGTIADTFFIAKDIFRKLAAGRHPSDEKEIEILRSLSAREVLQRVRARWWQLPYIMYYARKQIRRRQTEINPIAGIAPVLAQLHTSGYRLYIVSSNATRNVQQFLERTQLASYFDGVYGGVGLFDKAAALRKITQKEHVLRGECYYVGDEARDIEAARRAHVPCISVTWGYNSLKGLQRADPDAVVDTPQALLKYIQAADAGTPNRSAPNRAK